jgi:hypothetical protein
MKHSIVAFCALILVTACGKKEQTKDLLITGEINGLKKGSLSIKRFKDTAWVTVDSVVFDGDSKFETELDLPSPEMLSLTLDRGVTENVDNELFVFAEPGQMTINTDLERFYAKAKITGSKNNDLYEEYKKVKSRYTDQQLELSLAGFNAKKDGKPFSEEENNAQIENVIKRKYLYAINFARNHADYEIAPYIALYEIANAQLRYLDTINNALTPKVAKSKYGKQLSEYIGERRKLEAQLPAATE